MGLPEYALMNGVGDNVYLIWKNGILQRINAKKITDLEKVEEINLVNSGQGVTAVQFMIGKASLLIGDSSGDIKAWFRIRPEGYTQGDGSKLIAAHHIASTEGAVHALAASARSRVFAAAYANGVVKLFNLTNELHLLDLDQSQHNIPHRLIFAPKEDGLIALGDRGLSRWGIQLGYPEISYTSLIRPIWYEGYSTPEHVWQSSSGDDSFEPKFGMWPLIFGTLKATFYSLIIGVPLALCAAIYTREFLHPKVRSVVKPTIEVMASLPSVVLGFLGALVIAPFIEHVISTIIIAFLLVPVCFALAGFLWHAFPQKWQRWLHGYKWIFIVLVLPVSLWLSVTASPLIENILFDGNFKQWLQQKDHKSASGWFVLFMPLAGILSIFAMDTFINPLIRQFAKRLSASREAYLNLFKFFAGVAFSCCLAWMAAQLLAFVGCDPRNSFLGVYGQRNALVVGLMMGFAIIPIIYTLAEDALSSVPDHLRSASLGCGATNWQTASRIVIPTAMSGIFSAIMVGLGRAVGETMIVLMSAGNTPVLDLNIFNGFRTLSANIAVELPEAVQGSTHYRTLFLAALALFVFTFLLNTIAESMRQRFRKRAFEL
ncbi:MAG: ABC transporter permease subunit [Planctomycetia bacterium]|nr:ABC transporter permease subunit [Planctomycetia bacterium]